MWPLDAETPDGMRMSVSLVGDNLHDNGGRTYVAETRVFIPAVLPNGNKVMVRTNGTAIHEDEDLASVFHNEGNNGIGFLGLHSESEYIPDDNVTFCSCSRGCALVDLGRYGPLLKTGETFVVQNKIVPISCIILFQTLTPLFYLYYK